MNKFWNAALAIGGLATVGAFVFWSLNKKWLSLPIFSQMTQEQTFVIMCLFLALVFFMLIVLVIAYIFPKKKERAVMSSPSVPQSGSVITSINQQGGQVAHSIVNNGPQDRHLEQSQVRKLVSVFSKASSKGILFVSQLGNDESIRFSDQIEAAAREAGMVIEPSVLVALAGPVSGVQLQYPQDDADLASVAQNTNVTLLEMGFLSRCDPGSNKSVILVTVGSNNSKVQW